MSCTHVGRGLVAVPATSGRTTGQACSFWLFPVCYTIPLHALLPALALH